MSRSVGEKQVTKILGNQAHAEKWQGFILWWTQCLFRVFVCPSQRAAPCGFYTCYAPGNTERGNPTPPRVSGILFTSVPMDEDASVLHTEIVVLLVSDAIEPVPLAEMNAGFSSPYFILPKKSSGLHPIPVVRALGSGASAPQPSGASGQLEKEHALPCAEHLCSWYGAGFGQHDSAVSAELRKFIQGQDSGPSKTLSEAPKALFGFGITPGCRHLFSPWSDPAFLWAGVPLEQVSRHVVANRCLQDGLGRRMQRACSFRLRLPPVSLLAQTLCKIREDEE
ncbi:Cytosolic phospholipase A2 [Labeo rohita]|uniref:Cytosolic phospholipase A2 n=1 Tax=Labeo rohita TaxID=84645 RepID=A0ABQ8L309_LABRO|nr:Cytosolic phospholipase A2 [Labeo rohita]